MERHQERRRKEREATRFRNLVARQEKGVQTMQNSMTSATAHASARGDADYQSLKRDHVVYQAVTVAAMLLLLGSLWVF